MLQYKKEDIQKTLNMAWPAMLESFFTAFAGLVDSLMVSSLGSYAVAAVGLTSQPKFLGLSLFIAANVSISALVARRKGQQKKEEANRIFLTFLIFLIIMDKKCIYRIVFVIEIILKYIKLLEVF